jgi:hypothetical protein
LQPDADAGAAEFSRRFIDLEFPEGHGAI